jgi:hypothetical protein
MLLEEIIEVTCASSSAPTLVEIGRALRDGRPESVGYVWSTGRITAAVDDDGVRLHRRLGARSRRREPRFTPAELRALARASADWAGVRTEWAAFYESRAGYPAGYGAATYFLAPGEGDRVVVGREVRGRVREGERLRGYDEIVPLAEKRSIDAEVSVIANIWRRGERFGDPAGSLVGCCYSFGRVQVHAYRRHACLVDSFDGAEVYLEPSEEAFVAALVAAVDRDGA